MSAQDLIGLALSPEVACKHSPSANPRHEGRCVKCGGPLPSEHDPRTAFDPVVQREFLRGAEKIAGLDIGWADRVADRVAAMDEKHGQRYRSQGIRRLLAEVDEEALDLGGWPVLASFVVNGLDVDEDVALEAKLLLQEIAAYGVRASNLVERVRELLT